MTDISVYYTRAIRTKTNLNCSDFKLINPRFPVCTETGKQPSSLDSLIDSCFHSFVIIIFFFVINHDKYFIVLKNYIRV